MLEDYKRAFPQPSYTFVHAKSNTLADVSKGGILRHRLPE